MALLVMKFGGSLTADAKKLSRVAQVIAAESLAWDQMVVVVSAMAGVTDALRRALDLAEMQNVGGYRRVVALMRERHLILIEALFSTEGQRRQLADELDRQLFDILNVCDQAMRTRTAAPRERDVAMACGEQIMSHILTALVRQEGLNAARVEAESLIITDESHQNANPLIDLIDVRVEQILRPVLDAQITPIIPGFVGATRKGAITTLGRGGSDYTATLIAAALRAEEVWLWTSVDGIMSTDPAWVPGARVIPALSYQEVEELAYFGTRVLHPDAIEPLIPRGIPLRVRNPDNLDHAGTVIQAEANYPEVVLKAVTAVDGLLLTLNGQPLEMGTFLAQVGHIVKQSVRGPVIALQSHQHTTLVFVIPTSEGPNAAARLCAQLAVALPKWEVKQVKVIAAFGPGATQNANLRVPVLATAAGTGNRRLFAVSPNDAKDAVRQLHKLTESSAVISTRQLYPQIKRE